MPTTIPALAGASPLARALTIAAREFGLPAYVVAEASGISPAALSMIARGKLKPSADTAQRIADALGFEREQLFPDLADHRGQG